MITEIDCGVSISGVSVFVAPVLRLRSTASGGPHGDTVRDLRERQRHRQRRVLVGEDDDPLMEHGEAGPFHAELVVPGGQADGKRAI